MSITFMLRIWPPAGTFYGHLRVRSFAQDGDRVLRAANDMLKSRFGIYLSTLQVERSACPRAGRGGHRHQPPASAQARSLRVHSARITEQCVGQSE